MSINFIKKIEPFKLSFSQKNNFFSKKIVQFQSGYIYDYAFVMLIGLSTLITFLILN